MISHSTIQESCSLHEFLSSRSQQLVDSRGLGTQDIAIIEKQHTKKSILSRSSDSPHPVVLFWQTLSGFEIDEGAIFFHIHTLLKESESHHKDMQVISATIASYNPISQTDLRVHSLETGSPTISFIDVHSNEEVEKCDETLWNETRISSFAGTFEEETIPILLSSLTQLLSISPINSNHPVFVNLSDYFSKYMKDKAGLDVFSHIIEHHPAALPHWLKLQIKSDSFSDAFDTISQSQSDQSDAWFYAHLANVLYDRSVYLASKDMKEDGEKYLEKAVAYAQKTFECEESEQAAMIIKNFMNNNVSENRIRKRTRPKRLANFQSNQDDDSTKVLTLKDELIQNNHLSKVLPVKKSDSFEDLGCSSVEFLEQLISQPVFPQSDDVTESKFGVDNVDSEIVSAEDQSDDVTESKFSVDNVDSEIVSAEDQSDDVTESKFSVDNVDSEIVSAEDQSDDVTESKFSVDNVDSEIVSAEDQSHDVSESKFSVVNVDSNVVSAEDQSDDVSQSQFCVEKTDPKIVSAEDQSNDVSGSEFSLDNSDTKVVSTAEQSDYVTESYSSSDESPLETTQDLPCPISPVFDPHCYDLSDFSTDREFTPSPRFPSPRFPSPPIEPLNVTPQEQRVARTSVSSRLLCTTSPFTTLNASSSPTMMLNDLSHDDVVPPCYYSDLLHHNQQLTEQLDKANDLISQLSRRQSVASDCLSDWSRDSLGSRHTGGHSVFQSEVTSPHTGFVRNYSDSFDIIKDRDAIVSAKSILNLTQPVLRPPPIKYQSIQCDGERCNRLLVTGGPKHLRPRYCYYYESWFCRECHANKEFVIPSWVVYRLDSRPKLVSNAALYFLESVVDSPLIPVSMLTPIAKHSVQLTRLLNLKFQLGRIRPFLLTCKDQSELIRLLANYVDLLETQNLSLKHILEALNGSLVEFLLNIIEKYVVHITQDCVLCTQKVSIVNCANPKRFAIPLC
ncbi:hypothetical protein GEMRC1_008047 [Eukaryota sp. GEM-RC1]